MDAVYPGPMDLQKISLAPLLDKTVAILGYGNQGRAHGLNLRDSGVRVLVGARAGGKAEATARADGFTPLSLADAAGGADVVMLLLPDEQIPSVYRDLGTILSGGGKKIGFAHGFAFHFGFLP